MVNKLSYPTYTNFSNRLTYCVAGTTGTTCTLSTTKDATRSIGLDLGITRSAVAASLNISSAWTRSVSVSCTSPALTVGQKFAAYPRGTKFTYRIKRWGTMQTTTYSSYLSAFNPDGGILCRVE